jgi:hypothetical protein
MKKLILLMMLPVILSVGGWIANIVKMVHMDCGFCAFEILRIIGIFIAPIGVILGYL